ncbi:MAG: symmetrical bis(5'-nucleosyl)-tetraphosphatase [Magnetococcales bacterium]|nr:symmetrical bis(5'-nucleosyl)-tetraphosphatase [Magnetococcales bacterium]
MAVYAIGDLHGCFQELHKLLDLLKFNPGSDRLLFVGDLVNRGPDSLGCLRFVRDLGPSAGVVAGNHEINVLRLVAKGGIPTMEPWQEALHRAPDRNDLIDWMSRLPLMLHDQETGFFVIHAGCLPAWSLSDALAKARQIGLMAAGSDRVMTFYAPLKPPSPGTPEEEKRRSAWEEQNLFTRMRLTTRDGRPIWPQEARRLGLANPYTSPPPDSPCPPWYQVRRWQPGEKVVYGHWAAMGLILTPNAMGLDSGCVYGGRLTALRLDHPELLVTQVPCPRYHGLDAGE